MKYIVKLKKKHPAGKMRMGLHMVERLPKVLDLNETEIKELSSYKGEHWFEAEKGDKLPEVEKKEKPSVVQKVLDKVKEKISEPVKRGPGRPAKK